MADPNHYGTDIGCGPAGIDETFSLVEGRQALIEAIVGRLETPRGGLLDDPTYGLGVTAWVGKRADAAQLFAWGQALASEARKDDRVRQAKASLKPTHGGKLRFVLAISPLDGPDFELTGLIGDLALEILTVT